MRPALLALLPLLHGCALFTLARTGASNPRLDGTRAAPGLSAALTIHRDAHGIPHIEGATENDAWYGLGYVHAQDRLFHLDLRRRLVHGRISELLGERAVELDAFVQAMELEARGQAVIDASDPATQARVAAYTAGLNAGVDSLKTLPVEYRLLGVDFEPWDAADTTAMLYLLGWGLQENLDHELASIAFAHLPSDDLDALFQTYDDTPPIDPHWETLRKRDMGSLTKGFEAFTGAWGGRPKGKPASTSEASNNWIVGGDRTASGKPILANDPHLVQSVPSIWYAAHLKGGDLHVAGATVPGSPGVIIGHNERVGWGLTNVMADTVDIAVLERDGDGLIIGGRREVPEVRTVTIRPKDAEPVEREVLTTSIGPVINEGGEVAMVLRWTGLTIEDETPAVLSAFAHAQSTPQLFEELEVLASVAPQNVVSADVDGEYGWRVMGSIPRRHGFTGRVPHLGTESTQHWDGMHDVLPGEDRPKEGYLVTANSRPDPDVHPSVHELATLYIRPHRYDRIHGELARMEAATPAGMQALQLDLRDNAAATYLPGLLDLEPNAAGASCHGLLTGWADDGYRSTVDSAPAAVWAVFQLELWRATFADRFDEDQLHMLIDVQSTGRSVLDGEFDRFHTDEAVRTALDAACDRLRSEFGAPEAARWGSMHHLDLRHPFSAQSSLLKGWDMGRREYPGSGSAVSPADYDWNADDWTVGFMASMRIVMPMDDLGATTFVHPGGQSGQPKSPFYRSHYQAFVDGEVLPLWFDADDVAANAVHTLVLEP